MRPCDQAIECVNTASPSLKAAMAFEHAYSLYRANKVSDAMAVLKGSEASASSFRGLQLRAQLLYRDGQAEASAKIYEQLFTVRLRVGGGGGGGVCVASQTRLPI